MAATEVTHPDLVSLRQKLSCGFGGDTDRGLFKLDRSFFTDEQIFALELKYIFENNWIFVAHESQIPNRNDFLTTYIGRQPVVVTRNAEGIISCFVNACAHRGAKICRVKTGNRRTFTCMFHGWVYDNEGRVLDVNERSGFYAPAFDKGQLSIPQARVESYRGFVFASLNPNVEPLKDYLGGAATIIDLVVDQSVSGEMEVVRGRATYSFDGNWKLASENGVDGYHAPTVHASYIDASMRNAKRVIDLRREGQLEGGYFYYGNGHATVWSTYLNPEDRPNFVNRQLYLDKFGEHKTKWMMEKYGNTLFFPNLLLSDSASTQIRIIRPIAVNKTEVTTYCFAPVGESPEAREQRLRQYEDFYNATGIATPDDLTEFNNCQEGFQARAAGWSDLSRGAAKQSSNPQDWTWSDGVIDAVHSANTVSNEGIYLGIHGDWCARMLRAIESELETSHVG